MTGVSRAPRSSSSTRSGLESGRRLKLGRASHGILGASVAVATFAAAACQSSAIMAAAFSAIINVGELVLPDVMVGMTEASAMRRPSIPCALRRGGATATACGGVSLAALRASARAEQAPHGGKRDEEDRGIDQR